MFKIFDIRNSNVIDPDNPEQKSIQRYYRKYGGGHFVKRADGKYLVTYTKLIGTSETVWTFSGIQWVGGNRCVVVGVVDTYSQLFNSPNAVVENEWIAHMQQPYWGGYYNSFNLNNSYFCTVPNTNPQLPDSILLFVYDPGSHSGSIGSYDKFLCYRSLNGLGTDFALLATIDTINCEAEYIVNKGRMCTVPLYMPDVGDNGRIVVGYSKLTPLRYWTSTQTIQNGGFGVAYSDNLGVSWTLAPMPLGGTELLGGQSFEPSQGIARFGSQLVTLVTNTYGWGFLRYLVSNDYGETWTRMSNHGYDEEEPAPGDAPALPAADSGNDDNWIIFSKVFNGLEGVDDYNYMLWTGQVGHKWRLYRRLKTSPINEGSAPSLAGWEGPLHENYLGDDGYESYFGIMGGNERQLIHVVAGTSHAGTGAISYGYQVGNFKFAIAGIYDGVIKSTFPAVVMMIVYAIDLNSNDKLHFKLKSSEEEINTEEHVERFGYSMNGGASWTKFPSGGVPAVNPYNLLVAANIAVKPGTRATLSPSVKIMANSSSSGDWWVMDFTQNKDEWWNLGLGEGDTAEEWTSIFEHEVEGLPEE